METVIKVEEKQLSALMKVLNLKDEKRTGWELRNIQDPESVADHSWSTAFLTLIYAEKEEVDRDKALRIALIHDLGEAEIGDIAHRAVDAEQEMEASEKSRLERETVEEISSNTDEDIIDLWKEYEERKTREAIFVKDMDMIDMCLQALKYESQERYDPEEDNENFQEYDDLDEFFATTEPRLKTDTGKQLFKQIREKYRKARNPNPT
ncbi:MAG: putative hydrolase of HD superfamily [Candidatus Nanohaloarchaea archaeon]|jgi:putative hydrolase of HD superfamily